MMRWKPGDEVDSPEKLDTLPPGTVVLDGGLRAERTESGAFRYDDGDHWEPEMFPLVIVSVPHPVPV